MFVCEGEGMPGNEIETVEEEDLTKEDIEANTQSVLLWRLNQNPLTAPSIEDTFCMCQSRRSGRHSLLQPKMQPQLCKGPRQIRHSSHRILHSMSTEEMWK